MREILYLQAGKFSNFAGSHFWNTQEGYSLEEDSRVNTDISFRASEVQDQPLCPRSLIFDWKGNWGTLNRNNSLGQRSDPVSQDDLWSGDIQEIRQTRLPPSAYHEYLNKDERDDDDVHDDVEASSAKRGLNGDSVRYWSDYTRVFYAPNTIQQVSEPAERVGESGDLSANWGISATMFTRHNETQDLMEDSVRLALEECDSLQGLQVLNDVDGFGGFTSSFLTTFRDEYSKTATLAFGVLSSNNVESWADFDINNTRSVQATMTDALYLRAMQELASLTVPLQPPTLWEQAHWKDVNLNPIKRKSPYYSSAKLSSFLESATLPLRLGTETIASFTAKVSWQTTAPYGELMGTFPLSLQDLSEFNMGYLATNNFSRCLSQQPERKPNLPERFSTIQVSRGFSETDVRLYDVVVSGRMSSAQVVTSYHADAYSLPSSFPCHIWRDDLVKPKTPVALPGVKGVSSIVGSQPDRSNGTDEDQTHSLRGMFEGYAKFADECLRKKDQKAMEGVGVDPDDVRELANDLWTIVDGYGGRGE